MKTIVIENVEYSITPLKVIKKKLGVVLCTKPRNVECDPKYTTLYNCSKCRFVEFDNK